MEILAFIWILLACYLGVGFVFALFFLSGGAARMDAAARGISWQTKALLLPGSVVLWPVLLVLLRKKG